MSHLKIGIPSKGRLAELTTSLLDQAGMRFRRHDRTLFARVKGMPIDITFLRACISMTHDDFCVCIKRHVWNSNY